MKLLPTIALSAALLLPACAGSECRGPAWTIQVLNETRRPVSAWLSTGESLQITPWSSGSVTYCSALLKSTKRVEVMVMDSTPRDDGSIAPLTVRLAPEDLVQLRAASAHHPAAVIIRERENGLELHPVRESNLRVLEDDPIR